MSKAKKIKPSPPEPPKEQPTEPFIPSGKPIPNSRYFRGYCPRCRTPTRVKTPDDAEKVYCEDCEPRNVGVGNPHGSLNSADNDPDAYRAATDQD